MTAWSLARMALRRPTERALGAVLVVAGGWYGWSPGTAFGLPGLYGGWLFASRHLLDTGLVVLAVGAALVGSSTRVGRIDHYLQVGGRRPGAVVGAVMGAGAMVAETGAMAFAVGSAGGGLVRSVVHGGPEWAGGRAGAGVGADLLVDGRLVMAVALVGALGALVGWIARRDDLAVAGALVLTVGYLDVAAPVLSRAQPLVSALALTPMGALRVVATADRGLAAPGAGRAAPVWAYALVVVGWSVVALRLAIPTARASRPPTVARTRSARTPPPSGVRSRVAWWGVVVAVGVTVVAAAVIPPRVAAARPWRWQSSWREAHRRGSASDQVVDRYLGDVRAGRASAVTALAPGTTMPEAVLDAIRRAARVQRQPVSSMTEPDLVGVALGFDHPVMTGRVGITRFALRFGLVRAGPYAWRIKAVEGPVAVAARQR